MAGPAGQALSLPFGDLSAAHDAAETLRPATALVRGGGGGRGVVSQKTNGVSRVFVRNSDIIHKLNPTKSQCFEKQNLTFNQY